MKSFIRLVRYVGKSSSKATLDYQNYQLNTNAFLMIYKVFPNTLDISEKFLCSDCLIAIGFDQEVMDGP